MALRTVPSLPDDTRGIVHPAAGFQRFALSRHEPSAELAWAVDRYWVVRWDLRDRDPYDQRIIPHPAVHLVFEAGTAEIQAVSRREFVRHLEGRGQVLGVKFQPAGFRPFLGRAVASIADQRLPAATVFGAAVEELAATLAAATDLDGMAPCVDGFLRSLGIGPLAGTEPINRTVAMIAGDRSVTRVDDLAARLRTSTRRLQRLFADHVGLGPKWVINRARIHEVAEQAGRGAPADWARQAAELGYSDQSHLVRDFTAAVGTPPARYARGTAPWR